MRRPALALALLVLARTAAAHDHWIAPSSFRPAEGERVALTLCVGHPGAHEEQLRDPQRIRRFEVIGPDATRAVAGLDGRSPGGWLVPRAAGLHVVVYRSDHAYAELDPATYAEYLRTKGLDDVAAERERRGERDAPGRDSYARFDKALVRAGAPMELGEPGEPLVDRPVGLPLELVLDGDERTWRAGAELVVRLELDGAPLAGRQVELARLAVPHRVLVTRTDAAGRARFSPDVSGPWCAFAVHQRRIPADAELRGDWEGLWASLAFELDAPRGAAGE